MLSVKFLLSSSNNLPLSSVFSTPFSKFATETKLLGVMSEGELSGVTAVPGVSGDLLLELFGVVSRGKLSGITAVLGASNNSFFLIDSPYLSSQSLLHSHCSDTLYISCEKFSQHNLFSITIGDVE